MLPTNSPLYMLIFWHSILCFSAARETIPTNFNNSLITDGPDGGTTIVSAGGMFELGFFTPSPIGSLSNSRYVGIWYSKLEPKTVVWVANRDKPINGSVNSFVIADDGNLNVLDEMGEVYWSSNVNFAPSSVSKTAKLMNSGNLVLSESRSGKILWESFKNPTDTFLPGMKMDSDEDLVLTSWKSLDDPAGGMFELGFFTPNGSSSNSRYLGIWYSKLEPKTVVWVANRDEPLNGTGFVIADDGNLNVLDEMGRVYWSSNVNFAPASVSKTAKLMNSGNLVLSESRSGRILWESFKNPTDTFLPGMKMDSDDDDENLVLTSWKSLDDPARGNFTFQIDEGAAGQFTVLASKSITYWRSSKPGKFISSNRNQIPSEIADLLSNFNVTIPSRLDNSFKRLVMGFDGKLRYFNSWDWDSKTPRWNLSWFEPRDQCSVYKACGNLGCCNLNNSFLCKCLPGFKPISLDQWNSGDFSGGCSRKSQICGKNDTFLSLKKMNVRNPELQFKTMSKAECRNECLDNCDCQAYAYDEANTRRVGDGSTSTPPVCWIWNEDLNNLQEDYDGGRNFYVRVALSDIEQTVRDCEPCGTNMIPYPLSTGPNCGDPMYFSFYCDNITGHVSFQTPSGIYRVIDINPETRAFFIKYADMCRARNYSGQILQLDNLPPFHANNWCNAGNFTSAMASESRDELEISWDPPLEPMCVSSPGCKDWPDSTCNAAKDGKKRCLCIPNFRWDNSTLNCTQVSEGGDTEQLGGNSGRKIPLSLIIAVTCSVFFLICLCCIIAYVFYTRRRVSKRQGNVPALELYDGERNVEHLMKSGQFRDDEKKGIDVPFFDLETLLAATDNFSDANKLGQGGFGPVYKGKFSGGQEIAVKRLSSFSGQGLQEFKNEVLLIAKLQHRNLVRLMGYCISGEEKMLLYEYMPNKSLDSFIFDRSLCMLLDWEMRFNIILGIARGLLYLHQDSRLRIIHRDLKTSNILLDEEMNPKISDFGLARIFGGKQTEAATDRIIGTYGYMSPEYALEGLFSDKSDVFSFGVVVLEIISGKRNTGYRSEQALSLLGYAWRLWKEEKALDLMDQMLHEKCNSNELLKCVNVGLLCVQEDPSDRPTMSSVVLMLGSETATLPSPKQPAFVAWRALSITASSSSKPETSYNASSSSKPETSSYNESSITSEDG